MRDPLPAPRDGPAVAGRILVLGVGHCARGDDAVGRLVARRVAALLAEAPPAVRDAVVVAEADGEGAALASWWAGARAVVAVDAVRSGAPAGTRHRIDVVADGLPAWRGTSSHAFGLSEGVALSRALGTLPPTVLVIGIEIADVTPGRSPGPAVAGAVEAAAHAVLAEVQAVLQSGPGACPRHATRVAASPADPVARTGDSQIG